MNKILLNINNKKYINKIIFLCFSKKSNYCDFLLYIIILFHTIFLNFLNFLNLLNSQLKLDIRFSH